LQQLVGALPHLRRAAKQSGRAFDAGKQSTNRRTVRSEISSGKPEASRDAEGYFSNHRNIS
jgi:hypothetical protein